MAKKVVVKAGNKGVVKTVNTVKFSATSKEVTSAYTGYQMGLASVREGFFNFLNNNFDGITKDTKKSDLVKAVPEDVRMKVQNFLYSWSEIQKGKLVLLKESKRPVAAGSSKQAGKAGSKATGKASGKADAKADLEKALSIVSDNIATLKSLKSKAAALTAVQELFKAFGIK